MDEDMPEAEFEDRDDDVKELDSPETHAVELDTDIDAATPIALPASHSSSDEDGIQMYLEHIQALPYKAESIEEMDRRLDLIMRRLVDCVETKDFDVGLPQWSHRLECWLGLKAPMKRETRARLANLYYQLAILPGMEARLIEVCANMVMLLLESKKRIDINDLILPWKPLYDLLERELFPKKRRTGVTNVSSTLLRMAAAAQRFFPPHEADEMLKTFLQHFNGDSVDAILEPQSFIVHFLPISHPTEWLPACFALWESFNSNVWDDQWLEFVSRLAALHVNPNISSPKRLQRLQAAAQIWPEKTPDASKVADRKMLDVDSNWPGIKKDVGIFTQGQWDLIMTKCLRAMHVPVGNAGTSSAKGRSSQSFLSSSGGGNADGNATQHIINMTKQSDPLTSFAQIIVYSMMPDGAAKSSPASASTSAAMTPNQSDSGAYVRQSQVAHPSYLGGSKALDSLAKLIQATESFFHPSNFGSWAPRLAGLMSKIASDFHKRLTEEERPECTTPQAWRINKTMKREFVLTLRTVALLSIYAKDPVTVMLSGTTLRTLAALQSDLIVPSIMERAYPALENVIETHRMTSTLTALAMIGVPLMSRHITPSGAKHLLPLLDLCIPGIDLNDPIKTMGTSLFIIQAFCVIGPIDNLNKPKYAEYTKAKGTASMLIDGEVADTETPVTHINGHQEDTNGTTPDLSRDEEDHILKESTSTFPDWISRITHAVLALIDNLPEPGKGGKAGGKLEEQVISSITSMLDSICGSLAPDLFDATLKTLYDRLAHSPRTNSARIVSSLVACFSRAYPEKTFNLLFPLCDRQIRNELEHGACSTPSTSTSAPMDNDGAFQWYCYLLSGSMAACSPAWIDKQDQLISLIQFMMSKVRSERGYNHVGRLLAGLVASPSSLWVSNTGFSAIDELPSDEYIATSHLRWGQVIESKDAKVNWHIPSQAEIDFVIRVLKEVVEPAVAFLEELIQGSGAARGKSDKIWANDFCRHCVLLKYLFPSIPGFVLQPDVPAEPGMAACDAGDEDESFIHHRPTCASGITLQDPSDPRHAYVVKLRERCYDMLHAAIVRLKDNGAEDAIDSVRMLIATAKTLLLDYPMERAHHSATKRSFEYAKSMTRLSKAQKKFPRFVWARRAALYESSRTRTNSFYRARSAREDQLILDLAELSLSLYAGVRRAAQRALELVVQYFDGTRMLTMDKLFDALRPSTDPDRMKGALYVLGSKLYGNFAVLDWRYTVRYILAMLACHHQEKPSIQALVKSVCGEFVVRLSEPSTLRAQTDNLELDKAARILNGRIQLPRDKGLQDAVAAKCAGRIHRKDEQYALLIPRLLEIAQNPKTHWRYKTLATRFLRALVRRDQPMNKEVAVYMASEVVTPLPGLRTHAMFAITKILHYVKMRTLAGDSAEKLLLQHVRNPLKRKVDLPQPVPEDFSARFVADLKKPMYDKGVLLSDKQSTGWLLWGQSVDFYEPPDEEKSTFIWEEASQEGLQAIKECLSTATWWDKLVVQLAQETSRDYLAADNTTLLKSIFQVFEDAFIPFVRPMIERMAVEKDRHKSRAGLELLCGVIRGAKHWPLRKQRDMWAWIAPLMPKLIDAVNPDTQVSAEMMVEYVLTGRDPRRNKALVDYITGLEVDLDSSEPFKEAKKAFLVGVSARSLGWHFEPWAGRYLDVYWEGVTTPFQEIRSAVTDNLATLSEIRLHPSFRSATAFIEYCANLDRSHQLFEVDDEYIRRIDVFASKLETWRKERQPAASGSQKYDAAALCILTWIWGAANGSRLSVAHPFIKRLLPDMFKMSEIQDNNDLKGTAQSTIASIASLPYPAAAVPDMMGVLMDLLRHSESWRIRLDVLPVVQVFFFNQLFILDDGLINELMDTLCDLLQDSSLEVREAAAVTLSGIVRCSQRRSILQLKERFLNTVRKHKLPRRRKESGQDAEGYNKLLVQVHSGVLGAAALISSHPYEVPTWMPTLLLEVMGMHIASPAPISTTVRQCLADFKKSHQDSWVEDQKAFDEEQLSQLSDLLVPPSNYYA